MEELALIVKMLAPELGRATYGEPSRGLTPWEIYGRDDAERSLNYAKKILRICEESLAGVRSYRGLKRLRLLIKLC